MGRLGRLRGDEKKLCAGSTVRVGFELPFSFIGVPGDFQEAVEGCLYTTGYFDFVKVQLNSGLAHVYVTVQAVTSADFGKREDFGDLAAGVIYNCGGQQVNRRDPVQLDSPPAGAGEDCQPRTVTDSVFVTPTNPNAKGILDQLFGNTGQSGGLLLLGGLALVAILVLKK